MPTNLKGLNSSYKIITVDQQNTYKIETNRTSSIFSKRPFIQSKETITQAG